MHHFAYRDGVLHAEGVNLAGLAETVGTPFYCYATATLQRHYRVFADAFAGVPTLICYAVKANSNQAVIATLAKLGAGADVVSGGELKRARAAGVPADKIMFSGIGKTGPELALALDENIFCVNVESEPELELLSSIAASKGKTANVSVRVNPDVDAKTHAKIATGRAENKFGIPISRAREVYAHAARLEGLRVTGVDMPARSRRLCRCGQARHAGPRLQADLRARPLDRRQRRNPGDAGHLCEARRGEDLRHCRCRHERPDPADALRRPPRSAPGRRGSARRATYPSGCGRSGVRVG
jgi:hypothetical protein